MSSDYVYFNTYFVGKTIEVIALILHNPAYYIENDIAKRSKATLIVVPPILIGQWYDELLNKVQVTETKPFVVTRVDLIKLQKSMLGGIPVRYSDIRLPAIEPAIAASPFGYQYDGITPLILCRHKMVEVRIQNRVIKQFYLSLCYKSFHRL